MDSKGRTLLILQGAASLQSLMFDVFSPSKGLLSLHCRSFESLHISHLTFQKIAFFSPSTLHAQKQVARELQKRCAAGLKENLSDSCSDRGGFQ